MSPSACPGVVGRLSRMSGSGREALSEVQELSGDPPGFPGVVGKPSRMFGVVGRPSRMSGCGREYLLDVRG